MAIEAQSLASLTNLASNPPLYPHNTTETPHAPLTLYIVRVPGSKDVFLSLLKPREKVVNVQDVQSSLYFLHVDDPEDQRLSASLELERTATQAGARKELPPRVARKPLPTPPQSPDLDSPIPSFHSKHLRSSPFLDLPKIPTRKPVRPPRKPTANQTGYVQREPSPTPTTSGESLGMTLTLIRRDPASGAQWNIAKIRDPPVEDVSSDTYTKVDGTSIKAKSAGSPLYIEINNPGYSKYSNTVQTRPLSRDSTSTASTDWDERATISDGRFRRRLWMDGSRFADHTYGTRKAAPVASDTRSSLQLSGKPWQTSPKVSVDRRSKGYAFYSPWNGKCEFSTGIAGRSLKCQHRMDAVVSPQETTTAVSELRFNLPNSGHVRQFGHASVDLDSESRRSSYFPQAGSHRHTLSAGATDHDPHWTTLRDEHGNIDYSLGQERAGGGFGGKQAKLGKLIIEDEGQKMLDLVVAANMALWWRAYERT